MPDRLDIRQLRQVSALAHHRTFSAAARALGITQPALTRSIQAIEEELGGLLFQRHARGVSPTPLGVKLAARADSMLTQMADLRRELDLMQHEVESKLRVGLAGAASAGIVARAFAGVQSRYPRSGIELRPGRPETLLSELLRREIGYVITERETVEDEEALAVLPLRGERLVWAVARGHPLACFAEEPSRQLRFADLAGFPIAASQSVFARIDGLLPRADRARFRKAAVWCEEPLHLASLVAASSFVGLLPATIPATDFAHRMVVLRSAAPLPFTRPVVVWPRQQAPSKLGEFFLSQLPRSVSAED